MAHGPATRSSSLPPDAPTSSRTLILFVFVSEGVVAASNTAVAMPHAGLSRSTRAIARGKPVHHSGSYHTRLVWMNAEGRSWIVQTRQIGLRCSLRFEKLCRADTACRPFNFCDERRDYSTKKVIFCESRSTPASVRIFAIAGLLNPSCIFSMDSISSTWYTLESSSLSWP